jgi:hypothetical protein
MLDPRVRELSGQGHEGYHVSFGHILFLAFILVTAGILPIAVSQIQSCDPYLEQPEGHPYGYRLRGNRCEGVYVQPVGNTILVLASLTESFEDYDLHANKDLVLQWNAPGNEEVRLRAFGLRRRLYYRMDTIRPTPSQSFGWPISLLAALEIPRHDLGILGWTQNRIGKTDHEVYVPLRITQMKDEERSHIYTATLLPGVELSEVYLSLATVGKDGNPETFLRDGEALGYNYYPADRRIDIPISGLQKPGLHYVEIGATLKTGGSATIEFWLYHPGS